MTRTRKSMSTMKPDKVRITQSLLSAYWYVFKTESGWDDFLTTLHREKKQPTSAMLDGIQYEGVLNSVLSGEHLDPDHKWYRPIMEMAVELYDSQQQVNLFRDVTIDGQPVLLHGALDFLRAGHIWDCKFSRSYHLNKYHWTNTPQTAMYLALVPEAKDFTYIISDGTYVYRERYPRDIVPPIEPSIKQFFEFLKKNNLWNTYQEKWRVNQ